jgi:hypothetical protein
MTPTLRGAALEVGGRARTRIAGDGHADIEPTGSTLWGRSPSRSYSSDASRSNRPASMSAIGLSDTSRSSVSDLVAAARTASRRVAPPMARKWAPAVASRIQLTRPGR